MTNKKKISFILLLFFVIFLVLSFFYIKKARYENKWPFNTGMGQIIPGSVKKIIYRVMTDDVVYTDTYYYKLKKSYYQIPNHKYLTYGGAIDQLNNDNILLISSYGDINIFNLTNKAFTINESNLENYESIRDINLDIDKKELRILATKRTDDKCATINFAKFNYEFLDNNFRLSNEKLIWQSEKSCNFENKTSGGRIVELNGEYLLSLGIFEAPTSIKSGNIVQNSQNRDSSFGKIIKIDIENNASIFALGFRNPQGLFFSKNKEMLFGTDHGPRGGDEVNIIQEDKNYGWPCLSYGKLYSKKINEEDDLYPNIETFKKCSKEIIYKEPLYAFAKSQGISQGLYYQSEYFKMFKENLIVSTLKGKSLYRFLLDPNKEKIVSMEKIEIGLRIRDVMTNFEGKIFITTDKGFLIIIEKNLDL
jgi:hypothetical protein